VGSVETSSNDELNLLLKFCSVLPEALARDTASLGGFERQSVLVALAYDLSSDEGNTDPIAKRTSRC